MTITELKQTAVEVRKGIVTATHAAKSGHPGGSLSATEIFTYLYFEEMNIDPKNPKMEDRDRFVLSKGHTAPGLYSALANRGYFPVKDLETLRHTGSYLQGHPDMKHIPGALGVLMKVQTGKEHEIDDKMASAVNVVKIDVESYTAKACIR